MSADRQKTSDPLEAEIELAVSNKSVSVVNLSDSLYMQKAKFNRDRESRVRYAGLYKKVLKIYEETEGPIRRSFFSDQARMWVLLAERDGLKIGCRPKSADTIEFTNTAHRIAGYAHEFVGESSLARLAKYARARSDRKWWRDFLGFLIERGYRRKWACLYILYAAVSQALGNLEKRLKRGKIEPNRDDGEFMQLLVADLGRAEQIPANAARLVYIRGLLLGLVMLSLFAVIIGPLVETSTSDVFAGTVPQVAAIFGALGATLSVLQRLQRDGVKLELGAGKVSIRFSALIRPQFGAVAGLLIYMIHVSGIFLPTLRIEDANMDPLFYAVVAFAAGFGERAFEDTLGVVRFAAP